MGRERKMWKNSHIEAKNAANSRLLARFLTKIWGILIIFIRDAISCKGLYKYYVFLIMGFQRKFWVEEGGNEFTKATNTQYRFAPPSYS